MRLPCKTSAASLVLCIIYNRFFFLIFAFLTSTCDCVGNYLLCILHYSPLLLFLWSIFSYIFIQSEILCGFGSIPSIFNGCKGNEEENRRK